MSNLKSGTIKHKFYPQNKIMCSFKLIQLNGDWGLGIGPIPQSPSPNQ